MRHSFSNYVCHEMQKVKNRCSKPSGLRLALRHEGTAAGRTMAGAPSQHHPQATGAWLEWGADPAPPGRVTDTLDPHNELENVRAPLILTGHCTNSWAGARASGTLGDGKPV